MLLTIRLLLVILLLSNGILSYAAPPPPGSGIRVVMDNNYPPYAFQDSSGKLQGVLVDQWHLWSEKTGIPAEIIGQNWGEAQRHMQAGKFDVIDTIFRNQTRE